MRVELTWMDKTHLMVPNVDKVSVGTDQVLRLYGYEVGGRAPILLEAPTCNLKMWERLS